MNKQPERRPQQRRPVRRPAPKKKGGVSAILDFFNGGDHGQPMTARSKRRALRLAKQRRIGAAVLGGLLLLVIVLIFALPKRPASDVTVSANFSSDEETDIGEVFADGAAETEDTAAAEALTEEVEVTEPETQNTGLLIDLVAPNPTNAPAVLNYTVSSETYTPIFPKGQTNTGVTLGNAAQQNAVANADRAAGRPTAQRDGWLPVFERARTNERIIAITVDDCFQAQNLRDIIDCALSVNGKLTIFPIGKNIFKEGVSDNLIYAYQHGFELENHTYGHNGLFHVDDAQLAFQIFGQNALLCKLLGVNYQCHFQRPAGGDAKDCQRIHTYIDQLGYYGIAHWSYCGSLEKIENIERSLAPGQIYLFHTTDDDRKLLLEFIPYAASQGYTLVTMNELFGYPENETSELIELTKADIVPLRDYKIQAVNCSRGCYTHLVRLIQDRLYELGYLADPGDGDYGNNTVNAVKAFQTKAGLDADGVAGFGTQTALFSTNAPKA